ncbi:MAG: hypothetical protein OEY14_19010, partial [Myxococcales bacterium]|nr:hypothetical protein [Myxococcales bacterium]
MSLECPGSVPEGSPVQVGLTHSAGLCCAEGSSELLISSVGFEHRLIPRWTLCDCCEACRCLGPIAEEVVDLGVLPPGRHVLRIREASCVIEVVGRRPPPPPPPGICGLSAADEIRMPRTLLRGQPLAISILERSFPGCSCQPSLIGSFPVYDLQLCECCEDCDCLDAGYEATRVESLPMAPPDQILGVAGRERPLSIRDRASCHRLAPTGLRIVPPAPTLVHGGPPIWWAVLRGEEILCCADP